MKSITQIIREFEVFKGEKLDDLRDESSGHLPPAVDNLIDEKAQRDRQTIEDGLFLLEYYTTKGNTDYLNRLKYILSKGES